MDSKSNRIDKEKKALKAVNEPSELLLFIRYSAFLIVLVILAVHLDAHAAQNLREAAEDLRNQIDSTAPLLGGVGVGIGCLLMMVGLGGLGRMIAATGATGFVLFTLWPTLQALIERVFHR